MTFQEVFWRKYPEEKPQKSGSVYITTCVFGNRSVVQALTFSHGYFVTHDEYGMPDRRIDESVIAWMPMPIPYERIEKNELPEV